ncbi:MULTISPECIES: hypothetical protein [Faecalibacterium]|uniref:hypothetical protein n=1 Tax=Faecalibacterium TaxID=216851 RepID=UPI000E548613|nr:MULTISPECIES: hypothetical protein [Faecalibacterium]RHQ27651.1 hypothetical protein DWY95_08870 [Faecalibacterium sp. AF28-13AC]
MARKKKEDFDVVTASQTDDGTVVLTSVNELSEERMDNVIRHAIASYDPENKQYSTYLKISASSETLTVDRIDELARGLQSSLTNVQTVNGIIRNYINKDDLIGITYDAIEANVNTEFKCSFAQFPEQRNKTKQVNYAREVVDDFNTQINVRSLLRAAIPMTYAEGTYITYLRQKDENYIVDYYPLGIAEISDYLSNGQPVVLINMSKLKSALSKSMLKDKKNKALFFENQETEIQNNYPDEVYQAFKNGDTYAKLDVDHCGVIRIGNMGQKYGVSPLFRALRPALMLETFDTSDRVNAKAKAKKIIWQQLDPELMGPNKDKKGFSEQVTAHDNLLRAWKQNTVLVTTAPYVKDIKYVEPKVEMTNIETVKQYRNREMAALGISFLNTDGQQTVSTAKVSLDQLMKNIGKIAEQIEDVLKRWYRIRLEDAGVDTMYCPDVKVSTTEMMGMEMKKAIAQFLFTTLNCSYKTAYEYMGLHAEDELRKRQAETEEGYDDVFVARQTSYTSTGNSSGGDSDKKTGRPKGEETEKQIYDQQRNEDSK